MNARSYPFLRLLAPLISGLVIGCWYDLPIVYLPEYLLVGALVLIFLAVRSFSYRFRWVFGTLLSVWLFAAAYFHIVMHHEGRQADHFTRYLPLPDTVQFIGTVYESPSIGARCKIPVRLTGMEIPGAGFQPCSGNVLLFSDSAASRIQYGDQLICAGVVEAVKGPNNPDAFDYRRYLHFQNIHYQCFTRDSNIQVLVSGGGNWLWRKAYGYRNHLLEILQRYFPAVDEYAVASALLLGYKDDLSDELRVAYAETGSMHALAVSGTHVGMLYAGLFVFMRRIPFKGRYGKLLESGLILVVIWGFTFLTGATASVLRASVMFSAFLLGKAIHRDASAWNILTASAFLLLVYNPYFIMDAGFQLSYAAVAGMVFFYPRFYRLSPLMPYWMDVGWKALLVGFSAQIGTLPLGLFYFHQFPVYFWLSGWVVVLGGAIFLWGGALLIVLDAVWLPVAQLLGYLLNGMLWGMNQIIVAIQHLPGSVIQGIWIESCEAFLMYLAIVFFGAVMVEKKAKWLIFCLFCCSLLLGAHAFRRYTQIRQTAFSVYAIPKLSLIEWYNGRHLYVLGDDISAQKLRFVAQNHRWALGATQTTVLPISTDTIIENEVLCYIPPLLQFRKFRLAIIQPSADLAEQNNPVTVDALLLHGSPACTIAACIRQFPCKKVFFDASNKRWKVEKWKKECQALQISFEEAGFHCPLPDG